MTPAERLMAERERIQKELGFYITPYRLSHLMQAASKITDILVKADTNICFEECNIVLAIVAAAIASVTEGGDDDA